MYKLQMKFQSIISYLCIAAAALAFVYSLGVSTDAYLLYRVNAIKETFNAEMFYALQPFNKTFTNLSIVLIVLSVAGLVFNNHTRRKYYIANYCTVTLSSVASVSVAVWSLINVLKYKEMFLNVDFGVLQEWVENPPPPSVYLSAGIDPNNPSGPYSTFWFDLCWLVSAILIITAILNVANMIYKTVLMNQEKQLLKGEEV